MSVLLSITVLSFSSPVTAQTASAPQLDASQQEAVNLLQRSLSSRLSVPEQERLQTLLRRRETASGVPLQLVLAVVEQRQLAHSFEMSEVVGLVNVYWREEPAVIAFYRDALVSRGPDALADLAVFSGTPWDSSFIEPLIDLIDAASGNRFSFESGTVLTRGVSLMDRHYASWSSNPSIAPRLSKAVAQSKADLPNYMYNWFNMVAQTHDLGMISVLRPFLTDKTIDSFTSLSSNMPSGVTPMRNCELAANAIVRLLGEPIMFSPWQRAKAPPGGPYPEWREWDDKIAALQQRLNDPSKK